MSSISLDAFDAKSKSALSFSEWEKNFDANPSAFFFPRKKCPVCKGPRCLCNCLIIEGFEPDANTAGITEEETSEPEPETPMQKPDAKKPSHPSHKEYLDALAYIEKNKNNSAPFTSFDQVKESMKNLQIIKACHRANDAFLKEENKKARIRIEKEREAEKQAEIEAEEKRVFNRKLKAWAKSTITLLKSMR